MKIEEQNTILIEVGAGELIDKITILVIKSERINNVIKLKNVRYELAKLDAVRRNLIPISTEMMRLEYNLKEINMALWITEDCIRQCEINKDFGPKFVDLARAIYKQNDRRASLKKDINRLNNSIIIEEKSYMGLE
jgi:hypothetical protein